MHKDKITLIADIKKLSNELDIQYRAELNFRNHCYLRIAYDSVIKNKWDLIVKRPFTKYADPTKLEFAVALLRLYSIDKKQLLLDNEKSLGFRKNEQAIAKPMTLF